MFGLEVHCVPFTIEFPLTLPVGHDPNDLGVGPAHGAYQRAQGEPGQGYNTG